MLDGATGELGVGTHRAEDGEGKAGRDICGAKETMSALMARTEVSGTVRMREVS